jgi:DNA-binding MarR family transcriptional regulator
MKALSQTRVEILKALKERNKTLSELSKELGLSKATLFRHLVILQAEGIVRRIENGNRFVYYKLSQKGREILELIISAVIAFTGSIIAYLSAYRLSGVSEPLLELPSPAPAPISVPAVTPAVKSPVITPPPTPTPIPAPRPAGGFLPDLPDLPETGYGAETVTYSSTTSSIAAAILAFLFIFVIITISLKLIKKRNRIQREVQRPDA